MSDLELLTFTELKAKANELEIPFPGNISKASLIALIEAKENPIDERVGQPEVNADTDRPAPEHAKTYSDGSVILPSNRVTVDQIYARESAKTVAKRNALRLRKVQVTCLDPNEAAVITTVTVRIQNRAFGTSAVVPLGIPCELTTAVIQAIRDIKINRADPNTGFLSKPGDNKNEAGAKIYSTVRTVSYPKYAIQYLD